jgi:enoyl-CoA hydratase/carnithine racemase
MLCDLRFASDRAVFLTAFAHRGLIAEHGLSWILPRLIGPSRALDLLWSSRKVEALEAERLGIVNRVIPHERLLEESRAYLQDLAAKSSPTSLKIMKQQVYKHLMARAGEAMEESNRLMADSLKREDFREGVASFVEKRPPRFDRVTG